MGWAGRAGRVCVMWMCCDVRRAVVVVDAVAVEVGGDDGDVGAAAPLPLSPLLPPTTSPLRGCQFVCSVHCKHVGAGAGLSLCSALCTIGASHARAGSGARMAGIRDELRTSRVMAGAALGPAVASVGGAAIAPRAIRGLFTAEVYCTYIVNG